MSAIRVSGWGSLDAKLVLVGEASGPREVALGEPFVGPSGFRLREWWAAVELQRSDFRIENCCEFMPPRMNAAAWDKDTWHAWFEDLHDRLAHLTDPWVLIPCGNYALYALTGKGKVPWHLRDGAQARPGILDWRGSLLTYTDRRGRTIKVVPTPHPAATFRDPSLESICRRDWERISTEAHTRDLALPHRVHNISPTLDDIHNYFAQVGPDDVLAFDIENPETKEETHPIVCIAFSKDSTQSITIPTTKQYWRDPKMLEAVWTAITSVLETDVAKCTWNNFHEQYWLWMERGITINGDMWDGMYLHHALDAAAPHTLAFCASVDTRQPYWKSTAKDEASWREFASNEAAFFTYCGLDACVTRELFDVYYQRLGEETRTTSTGVLDGISFYAAHYAACYRPLLDLMQAGIRIDDARRAAQYEQLRSRVAALQAHITESAGYNLFAKKSLSTTKLQKWLYEDLKLPVQFQKRAKGEKTASAGEVVIRKLMRKYPDQLGTIGPLILDYRRTDVLSKFYLPQRVDDDGYFRSSYGLNTEAGRLKSKASPRGTGSNAQNVDREARDMFLADPGCLGIEVDLSQAEARLVYLAIAQLTQDPSIRESATLRPDEYDQHTENAALIFGLNPKQLAQDLELDHDDPRYKKAKEQRYFGKKTVHGAQRDLHGNKMSDEVSKDGYSYTPAECQAMLDVYRKRVPGLDAYFRWVRARIIGDHYCENSWGRRLWFNYERLNEETYRRGYSFYPQSDVADHMNQKGLIPLHQWFEEHPFGRINVHNHDALFFSIGLTQAYDATKFLVDSLEAPYRYYGVDFVMPCEIKLGLSWKGSKEWKRMPSRNEFELAAYEIAKG